MQSATSEIRVGVFCRPLAGSENDVAGIKKYCDAVTDAGGTVDRITLDGNRPEDVVGRVDALLFPGGAEVDPALYGATRTWSPSKNFNPDFDRFQIACAQLAFAAGIPLLGICRGQQVLNVAAQGTLLQDIDRDVRRPQGLRIEHRQQRIPGLEEDLGPTHVVRLQPGSVLHALFETTSLAVNSFHHQAVATVAPLFAAVAWSPDGVIEGIERKDLPCQIAVQWHPERQRQLDPVWNRLFDKLVYDGRVFKETRAEAATSVGGPASSPSQTA